MPRALPPTAPATPYARRALTSLPRARPRFHSSFPRNLFPSHPHTLTQPQQPWSRDSSPSRRLKSSTRSLRAISWCVVLVFRKREAERSLVIGGRDVPQSQDAVLATTRITLMSMQAESARASEQALPRRRLPPAAAAARRSVVIAPSARPLTTLLLCPPPPPPLRLHPLRPLLHANRSSSSSPPSGAAPAR